MRLEALDLIAYGPFTNRRLDFAAPFTIAYGLNEAGKSSALRALLDALYGIHGQTPDDFIHPYNSLRIGFELSTAAGRKRFIRRKGRLQTLRADDDSTVIEDSDLERALHGIGRETFANMFGISHRALVEGGKALAEGKGEIGKLLFVSAAGLAGMQTRLTVIENQAAELYAPRGKKVSIQQSLHDLREAEQQLKEKQVVLAKFQENQKALAQAAQDLAAVDSQVEDARREAERLTRIREALPSISQRRQAAIEFAQLQTAPSLPDDFGERLRDAEARLRTARDAEAELCRDLARTAETIASFDVPQDLLAADEPIRALFERKAAIQKSRQDCTRKGAELGEVKRSIVALVGKLRPGAGLEDAAGFEPGLLARNRIQELAPLHVRLAAEREALARALQEARRKLAESDAQIASLPAPPDTTLLAGAVERARRTLDARRARDLRLKLAAGEAGLSAALRSLAPWTGAAGDLDALPVPAAATVEEFREAFQSAAAEERAAREKLAEIDRQIAEARAERERIVALEGVPTLGDLAAARALRDSGWSAVKRLWKSGDGAEEREFLARAGKSDLAAAYEGAVIGADRLADRMRDNAQRVEQLAALELAIRQLERRQADARGEAAAKTQSSEAVRERWVRLWLGCGIAPESAPAMLVWLRRRDDALQQAAALREQRLELDALQAEESAVAADLRRLLAPHTSADGASASELLGAAESVLAAAAKATEHRQSALALREAQRFEIARMEREIGEAGERRNEWQQNWAAALGNAGLPPDLSASGAELYLNTAAEIAAALDKAKTLEHRIAAMQSDADEFAAAVAGLSQRLNPSAAGLDPEAAIAQLHQALLIAHQNRKLLEQEQKRQREIETKRFAAEQAAVRSAAALDALCRESGAPSVDAARECWTAAQRRAALERSLAEYDERIRLVSAGKTTDEFLAEAAAVDPDSIPGRLDEIRAQIAALKDRRAVLETARRTLDAEGLAMRGGDSAASVKQHMSGLVGRLAADVEQYVRLRAATFVIRKAIERYRDRNQGPVLERAAGIFAALTCGSFAGLRVENDEGAATLVGVRPDGRTVALAGMSDGSLDQLYLALRIASLEHYFTAHDPAPFIVDDVLLNFDDARAAAALEALDALSQKTQVILFTHHRRLVELAAGSTHAAVLEIGAR